MVLISLFYLDDNLLGKDYGKSMPVILKLLIINNGTAYYQKAFMLAGNIFKILEVFVAEDCYPTTFIK